MECKHRIGMAPIALTQGYKNTDGSLTQRAIYYFTEIAKGSAGLNFIS